jgi:hypothetical protein
VFATILSLALLAGWIFQETRLRRKSSSEPSSLRSLFNHLQKATTPDHRYSALGFAAASFVTFAAWEGMIRGMLQLETYAACWIAGFALFAGAYLLRPRSPSSLRREELWLALAGTVVLCQAWWTLVLAPWVLWRSAFLPSLRAARA